MVPVDTRPRRYCLPTWLNSIAVVICCIYILNQKLINYRLLFTALKRFMSSRLNLANKVNFLSSIKLLLTS